MKKLLVLAAVAVLAAGAAQAKTDLVSVAQQAQNKIDSLTQANEDAKANFEAKKKELEAKQETKKKKDYFIKNKIIPEPISKNKEIINIITGKLINAA